MVRKVALAVVSVFLLFTSMVVAPAAAASTKPEPPLLPEGMRATYVPENSSTGLPAGYYATAVNGYYYFRQYNGKCMGVSNSSQANGAAVIQWTCHRSDASDQRMLVYQTQSSSIWHQINPNHSSDKCLGVSGSSLARARHWCSGRATCRKPTSSSRSGSSEPGLTTGC